MSKKSLLSAIATVLLLAVVSYVVVAKPFASKPAIPPETKEGATIAQLYKQALDQMKAKNWAAARETLQHIAITDPKYKDVKELLLKVSKEDLYAKGKQALEQKDYDAAIAYLGDLVSSDPNFGDASQLLDEANQGQQDNPSGNSDANTNVGLGGLPTGGPMDALPTKVDGYDTLDKNWTNKPIEATGTYRSKTAAEAQKIDLVAFAAGKYADEAQAQNNIDEIKDAFSANSVTTEVNTHKDGYFGRYADTYYPRPAVLVWRNQNWVFSVTVLPKDKKLAESVMLQTALDFAKMVKY